MLKNLKAVFQENEVKFEQKNVQDLYGLLTKRVLLQHLTENFLSLKNMGQIKGQLKYNNSVRGKFLGDKSIWDPLLKEKLPTFVNNNCVAPVTVNKQLISLK